MKKIQIKAKPFFDLLKIKDQSMWDIFAQLIDGEEQEIIFTHEDDTVLFNYFLPENVEELKVQQEKFTEEFKKKVQKLYN
ncbi:hypothetical protein GO491_02390 [Flavobacteriaceae bacterium Ap0902]|nr:hypothetical protein [Flavobacteriaceae bacterium Ap0902]